MDKLVNQIKRGQYVIQPNKKGLIFHSIQQSSIEYSCSEN